MVGKPNVPADFKERDHELKGASLTTAGLNPLDQEREASMADEGGMSGAVMESQDRDIVRDPTTRRGEVSLEKRGFRTLIPSAPMPLWYVLGGLCAGLVLTVLFSRRG